MRSSWRSVAVTPSARWRLWVSPAAPAALRDLGGGRHRTLILKEPLKDPSKNTKEALHRDKLSGLVINSAVIIVTIMSISIMFITVC